MYREFSEVKLQAYQVQNQQLQAITIEREILQKLGVILPESVTLLDISTQILSGRSSTMSYLRQ